nr:aminoglycoside 6-adenylyltransferase [uncultured Arsenicibacter sp.]
MIPQVYQTFADRLIRQLAEDQRFIGVAAGGSWRDRQMDRFSDVDLVIVHDTAALSTEVRKAVARSAGNLLACFTGEHVGEPRLLICLYDDPLLHVDLKFVALPDMRSRVEDPVILWERDQQLSAVLSSSEAAFPYPDFQWIEDRFWVWIHYAATKIGRGELFETLAFISFMQQTVLGPLSLIRRDLLPKGVRKLEQLLPEPDQEQMQATLASYDRQSCLKALQNIISYYQTLRDAVMPSDIERRHEAEKRVIEYVQQLP